MNKERRKTIAKLISQLEDIRMDVDLIREEEQEYYDNMPESLQGSVAGNASGEAVFSLESASSGIDDAMTNLSEAMGN